jgi:hypothetical protein
LCERGSVVATSAEVCERVDVVWRGMLLWNNS